jgi:glycogen debranching enzyme GlgX
MTSPAAGSPDTPGVTVAGDGVNAAVHAPDADAVALCLFDAEDRETARIRLPARTGPVFHGHIPGVAAGTRYGLRAYGPFDPANGHRFNPAKLLIDPWATAIDRPFKLHAALFDHEAPRPDDTAALMPKAIVGTPPAAPVLNRPAFDWDRQVIYELHVRGFTKTHPDIPPDIRGTFAGLGHPAAIRHLTRLGITTVELMPSAAWIDERHLPRLNLTNYWGYNPMAFLAPDPRLAPGGWAEVRAAVDALHEAGISVILDVVLNHTGESDEWGPTLSMRGLDNAGYYRLAEDRSGYVNDAGCGNILAMDHPIAVRLSTDALRAWAVYGGLDGFRLDLAATLGRREGGFDRDAPFLVAVEQDPVLSRCAMIAEPWDIGPGGYQLGGFPARWGEWNDKYRDTVRRFWRGDGGMLGDFTTRFAGSADVFGPGRRPVTRSINFITAHDGFTLADLVSYNSKHNAANGEDNRDGSNDNQSWNNGAEGPSDDPAIRAKRSGDIRALLATLLLSRGTPMLSMGDEAARTQHGNNNAYAQDNAGSWMDWSAADEGLIDFTARLIALRQSLAPLFGGSELQGRASDDSALPDVTWFGLDGDPITGTEWRRYGNRTLVADMYAGGVRAALVFHADAAAADIVLPAPRPGHGWSRVLDSAGSEAAESRVLAARSVTVFRETPATGRASASASVPDSELDRLADLAGIDPIWWDVGGGFHKVGADTKRALLAAMRLPGDTRSNLADSLNRLLHERDAPLPPVVIGRADEAIKVKLGASPPAWITLLREDGSRERFPAIDGAVVLPPQPLGRHRLLNEDRPERFSHLTVAPPGCYLPPALLAGERRFGIAAHLYSLRSNGDQGIGDFTTLKRLSAEAARNGASLIGLNPLHALFPHNRDRASPYHPSDRRFLDPVYIDVSGFPGGAGLPPQPGPVDYPAVWARKLAILKAAFKPGRLDAIPDGLRRFATFETIAEVLGTSDWQAWPEELRHPSDAGVAAFAAQHAAAIGLHAFIQTLADEQLAAAAASARRDGLAIGFYRDLAVGAAPDGAEAWSAQDTLMHGVSVGAPPDPFSAAGQVWCLPPPDPVAMRRDGYASFNELLVANMRHAGALRIDHVMGLRRLFVVPDGTGAADGAYVTYPLDDLLAQVALQSQRARCLVVGEDLGTVPEGMSAALAAHNILSYSVLWFERRDGRIRPPPEWRPLAAACVSTHDLPTLAGWWNGGDIEEKEGLGLIGGAAAEQARADRAAEKSALVSQLQDEGLLEEMDIDFRQPLPQPVARAVHAFVAATPALLTLVQADDLAGETEAVNLPGTDRERPNWRRRLDINAEALCRTPLAQAILAALHARSAVEGEA